MFGGMNPNQMNAIMKKMGIKTTEINADEVIINGPKKIRITEPKITMMEIKGEKTFQIIGKVEEETQIPAQDIETVMEKTGALKEDAEKALKESEGDIAEAILKLS